jgi:hypothetical protein
MRWTLALCVSNMKTDLERLYDASAVDGFPICRSIRIAGDSLRRNGRFLFGDLVDGEPIGYFILGRQWNRFVRENR